MKKISIIILLSLFSFLTSFSQVNKIYNVDLNPTEQFTKALKIAENENKHVILQIGGNWCSWCIRFHNFYHNDIELDSLMKANYVIINVNYNPKNDMTLFTQLDYPQRFGFPVLVVTDAKGKRLHTQNSWFLEDGKDSYDKKKIMSFLKNWTPKAINPKSYKKK